MMEMTKIDMFGSTGQIMIAFCDAVTLKDQLYWLQNKIQDPKTEDKLREVYKHLLTRTRFDMLRAINAAKNMLDYYSANGINFHDNKCERDSSNPTYASQYGSDVKSEENVGVESK